MRGTDRELRKSDLVLRIELLFELGDFSLLGGGEVLGIVAAHLRRRPLKEGTQQQWRIKGSALVQSI